MWNYYAYICAIYVYTYVTYICMYINISIYTLFKQKWHPTKSCTIPLRTQQYITKHQPLKHLQFCSILSFGVMPMPQYTRTAIYVNILPSGALQLPLGSMIRNNSVIKTYHCILIHVFLWDRIPEVDRIRIRRYVHFNF